MDRQDNRGPEQSVGTEPTLPQDVSARIAELERALELTRAELERVRSAPKAEGAASEAHEAEEEPERAEPGEAEPQEEKAGEQQEPEELQGGEEEQEPEELQAGEEEQEPEELQAGEEEQEPEALEAGEEEPEHEGEQAGEEKEKAEEGVEESVVLFDGAEESMKAWKMVGSGELEYQDNELRMKPGNDRGLAYYTGRRFDDFRLKAQYRLDKPDLAASLAVRFLDPEQPVADREHPERKYRYDNQAYVAAHTGFEVSLGTGLGGDAGTLVGIPVGDEPGSQTHPATAEVKAGEWNEIEIEARGNDYTVRLNGVETARFTNTDSWRGHLAASGAEAGYVGILVGAQPQTGRQATRQVGPLPPQVAGPILPGRKPRAPQVAGLAVRRIELQVLASKAKEEEAKKARARKDLAALHQEVKGAIARLTAKDRGLEAELKKAYGYAVLPAVGRASLVVGAARGYGEVFEQGKPIGFTRVTQLTVGVQVGGQTFTQLILFGSKESLEAFKRSPLGFNGNLSAVFIRGASGTTNFKDVTAHAYSRGGMLLEASLGGQKYRFLKEPEAIAELAKQAEPRKAKTRLARAGRRATGFVGRLASRADDFLKKHGAE